MKILFRMIVLQEKQRGCTLQHQKLEICIVEDDDLYRLSLASLLKKYGRVFQFSHYAEAKTFLSKNTPDIAFIDLNLDGENSGSDLVEISALRNIYTVVISGHNEEDIIDDCLDKGAHDYYVKGDEGKIVDDIFNRLNTQKDSAPILRTTHPQFKQSLDILKINTKTDFPILLNGPTGSGKTFLARKIYDHLQPSGRFITINCSSIAPQLFESEMFGHVKGAFTGADKNYIGLIKEADKGVLFLDEIDSMPLEQQAKLLKVIEEKEFYPVGSNKKVKSNFKLVCAAQSDLLKKVSEGSFREDLYFRISGIMVKIPNLKERPDDLFLILKDFLKSSPRKFHFTKEAKQLIASYDWPGNLRELQMFSRNVLSLMSSRVRVEDISMFFNSNSVSHEHVLNLKQINLIQEIGVNEFFEKVKKELVDYYSEQGLSTSEMAGVIGVNRSTLHRWGK